MVRNHNDRKKNNKINLSDIYDEIITPTEENPLKEKGKLEPEKLETGKDTQEEINKELFDEELFDKVNIEIKKNIQYYTQEEIMVYKNKLTNELNRTGTSKKPASSPERKEFIKHVQTKLNELVKKYKTTNKNTQKIQPKNKK